MSTFRLPDLGEGLTEAEIVAWHVSAGDHVVADQPLVSVETDKALLDIPSPHAGRIRTLHGEPGDMVAVGAPLVDFAEAGETRDAGSVVGELPDSGEATGEGGAPAPPAPGAGAAVQATPAVRALAARLGVPLEAVKGTGPGGAVSRDDVRRAAGAGAQAASSGPGAPEALRGVRRTMARNMSRARDRVVPASLTDVADVHGWTDAESPMVRLVLAMVAACGAEPALNAWYLDDEQRVVRHAQVNLGIAADTEEGLLVPVLKDAGTLDAAAVAAALERIKAGVHERSIPPADLRGATISLSNFGMLGGEHAALVVLPPQVAILGAGRVAERPVAQRGAVAARRTLPLSLTFDHRAVTGAEAARFLAAAKAHLERTGGTGGAAGQEQEP